MSLRFGTDGVRGVANTELTAEFALALARAAARVLRPPAVLVGRDTRRSGSMLEAALCAGFAAEGVDSLVIGVAPTPAVAHLAASRGVAGAVISASHNPFQDNGIKLFAVGGRKLTDDEQDAIEAELASIGVMVPSSTAVGTVLACDGIDAYVAAVVATGVGLAGVRIVLDTANGAAVHTAPAVFRALGAEVFVISDSPDGTNINADCGATHPGELQREVVRLGADVGFAFDGDADRCLAVDASGSLIDGDQLIAALALDLQAQGLLTGDAVVVTVMTNLGFHQAMGAAGIDVVTTAVGDRAVAEALDLGGYALGGEQSGHVICRRVAATGDGVLTGVQFASAMVRAGRTAAELASAMVRLPQHLVNVRLPRRDERLLPALETDVDHVRNQLGTGGRVLVRPSGTEPLLRIMVEAPSEQDAIGHAEALANRARAIAQDLGTVH